MHLLHRCSRACTKPAVTRVRTSLCRPWLSGTLGESDGDELHGAVLRMSQGKAILLRPKQETSPIYLSQS